MNRLLPALLVSAFLLTVGTSGVKAQAAGATRKYAAGWNLIAAPTGTNVSVASSLYTAQPNDSGYEQSQPGDGTVSGFGYWAYVSSVDSSGYSRPVQLAAGGSAPYTVPVPAGQWVMVGDPSGSMLASVQGADVSYVFDPTNGFQPTTVIQPGQGAWVGSTGGSVVTVTPIQPSANAQAAYAGPPAGTPVAPPPGAQVSVTISQNAPNPAMPNPNTSYEPVPSWTYWPFPLTTNWAGGPAWSSSLPYSNPVLCSGYVVTGFALDYCGSLLGEPGPSAP
jgi:hypothetical protein